MVTIMVTKDMREREDEEETFEDYQARLKKTLTRIEMIRDGFFRVTGKHRPKTFEEKELEELLY